MALWTRVREGGRGQERERGERKSSSKLFSDICVCSQAHIYYPSISRINKCKAKTKTKNKTQKASTGANEMAISLTA